MSYSKRPWQRRRSISCLVRLKELNLDSKNQFIKRLIVTDQTTTKRSKKIEIMDSNQELHYQGGDQRILCSNSSDDLCFCECIYSRRSGEVELPDRDGNDGLN